MEFGISIPTCREGMDIAPGTITPDDIIRLAKSAEDFGFDSAWGVDHITPSNRIRDLYHTIPNFYEVITTLTYCAAITKNIKIATGVIVMPLREPILLAKQFSTLDALSGGRVIIGLGLGNNREEFQMLYPRRINWHRGKMLDESLEIFSSLLNNKVSTFDGVYFGFKDVVLTPKPIQKPFPIYLSGRSPKTIQRTAKFGTGLLVYSPTPEILREQIVKLEDAANKENRKINEFDIVVSTTLSLGKTKEDAIRKFQQSFTGKRDGTGSDTDAIVNRNLIGTAEDIIDRLGELEEAGLKHCAITGVSSDSIDERINQWEQFAYDIIPKFKTKSLETFS